MRVLTGSWSHDLAQARVLEDTEGVDLTVVPFDSHRLALFMDQQGKLVGEVVKAVCNAGGVAEPEKREPQVRLVNLL